MKQRLCCNRTESFNSFFYNYLLIGRGGTLVDSMPLDRKVVDSNPILAATPWTLGKSGRFCSGVLSVPLLSEHNRKLNITLNFRFHMYDNFFISVTSQGLDPLSPCHKLSHLLGPPPLRA